MIDKINNIFDTLDDWRQLPGYQLERRADIYFAAYMREFFLYKGIIRNIDKCILIPEFPLSRKLLYGATDRKSKKVDYVLIDLDEAKILFIELKTDNNSKNEVQDNYLRKAIEYNFKEIVDGILEIFDKTKSKDKYLQLFKKLYGEPCSIVKEKCTEEEKSKIKDVFDKPTKLSWKQIIEDLKRIEMLDSLAATTPKIVYLLPKHTQENDVFSFSEFSEFLERIENDYIAERFALSLKNWSS